MVVLLLQVVQWVQVLVLILNPFHLLSLILYLLLLTYCVPMQMLKSLLLMQIMLVLPLIWLVQIFLSLRLKLRILRLILFLLNSNLVYFLLLMVCLIVLKVLGILLLKVSAYFPL